MIKKTHFLGLLTATILAGTTTVQAQTRLTNRGLRPSSWCKLRGGHQLRKSGRGQFGEGRFITGGHAGHGLKRQVTML
jgi:hypothetical protein